MPRSPIDLPRMQNQPRLRGPLARAPSLVPAAGPEPLPVRARKPRIRQYDLIDEVKKYNPAANEELLNRAYVYAMRAHGEQKRASGDPYISHPLEVAAILAGLKLDDATIAAALLHDTIEDTNTDFDDIETHFGPQIAGWVRALTKDKREQEPIRENKYIEELAVSPWQVKACKLADVHDNLLDSEGFPPDRRAKTFRRSRQYLSVLDDSYEKVHRAYAIVQRLVQELDPQVV